MASPSHHNSGVNIIALIGVAPESDFLGQSCKEQTVWKRLDGITRHISLAPSSKTNLILLYYGNLL
jgi:hypothetical protein